MEERCPKSEKKEIRELSGYEFFINKRSYANVRPNKDKKVLGIIYEITEDDEKELDKCEGVQNRTNTKPISTDLNAFYYLAEETKEGRPREGYLEKIIQAAEVNDFPKEYVAELKSWLKK